MFSKNDFKVDSFSNLLSFMLVLPFVGLVLPFLLAAYTLGWCMDMVGWMET
jgi:hypothetical protein